MRVAALYDIHGNLPALEAVLARVRDLKVDRVVVGGDVVPGPMVRDTLTCLADQRPRVQYIHGNCEVAVLAAIRGTELEPMPEPARDIVYWTALELPSAYEPVFSGWPK